MAINFIKHFIYFLMAFQVLLMAMKMMFHGILRPYPINVSNPVKITTAGNNGEIMGQLMDFTNLMYI